MHPGLRDKRSQFLVRPVSDAARRLLGLRRSSPVFQMNKLISRFIGCEGRRLQAEWTNAGKSAAARGSVRCCFDLLFRFGGGVVGGKVAGRSAVVGGAAGDYAAIGKRDAA